MKTKKDELSEMIGYEISPEMKRMILKQVRETGKDIREIASQYILAPLITLENDGTLLGQWETLSNVKGMGT